MPFIDQPRDFIGTDANPTVDDPFNLSLQRGILFSQEAIAELIVCRTMVEAMLVEKVKDLWSGCLSLCFRSMASI